MGLFTKKVLPSNIEVAVKKHIGKAVRTAYQSNAAATDRTTVAGVELVTTATPRTTTMDVHIQAAVDDVQLAEVIATIRSLEDAVSMSQKFCDKLAKRYVGEPVVAARLFSL